MLVFTLLSFLICPTTSRRDTICSHLYFSWFLQLSCPVNQVPLQSISSLVCLLVLLLIIVFCKIFNSFCLVMLLNYLICCFLILSIADLSKIYKNTTIAIQSNPNKTRPLRPVYFTRYSRILIRNILVQNSFK
jgi:hypothetical protein